MQVQLFTTTVQQPGWMNARCMQVVAIQRGNTRQEVVQGAGTIHRQPRATTSGHLDAVDWYVFPDAEGLAAQECWVSAASVQQLRMLDPALPQVAIGEHLKEIITIKSHLGKQAGQAAVRWELCPRYLSLCLETQLGIQKWNSAW